MITKTKIRTVVVLLFLLTDNDLLFTIVAASNLRSFKGRGTKTSGSEMSTTKQRILQSSTGGNIDFYLHNGRMRHRIDPKERNIFIHHIEKPSPSEFPSFLPSLQIDEPTSASHSTPTIIPSSVSTVKPSPGPSSAPSSALSFSPSHIPSDSPIESVPMTGSPTTPIPVVEPPAPVANSPVNPVPVTNEPRAPGPPGSSSNNGGSEPNVEPEPQPTNGPEPIDEPNNDFTASSIEDFLSQTMSDSIYILDSPQNKALVALQSSSPSLDPNDSTDRIEILQRYALNTLYFFTEGGNWASNDFWTSASHPCGTKNENNDIQDVWFGIDCDPELAIVQRISLESNDLKWGLPPDIRALSGLVRLDVSNNQLSGALTESIGALTDLSVLDIGTNFFTGIIPQSIGNLKSLRLLDISNNFLSGSVVGDIAKLTTLVGLAVEFNYFKGTLASELFAITPLGEFLWVSYYYYTILSKFLDRIS